MPSSYSFSIRQPRAAIGAGLISSSLAITSMLGCASRQPAAPPPSWTSIDSVYASAIWVQESRPPLAMTLPKIPTYADQVRSQIRQEGKKLRRCYLAELKHDPNLYGDLVVELVLKRMGSVANAIVDYSTLSSPALEPCILKTFETLKFPEAPDNEYRIRVPIVFTSDSTAPEIMETLSKRYHLDREKRSREQQEHERPDDYKAPW